MTRSNIAARLAGCVLALSFATSGLAAARGGHVGAISISHPWSRPAPPGAITGAGYVTITNTGAVADRLLGGASPAADKVEVHEMSMTGGVMRMRPVAGGLAIEPGKTVTLEPGGYHLMLIGLKRPLKVGESVAVALRFQKAGVVRAAFMVESPVASMAGHDMQHGETH